VSEGVFVTGTDTEVGKTVVAAALAAAWPSEGPLWALKPLATGSEPPGEDATLLGQAAGHEPQNFHCWPTPCAPQRAAQQAGQAPPSPAELHEWIRSHRGPWIVEGVGGWEVPLVPGHRVSDLACALDLPVVVVAANRLGVLNHCLLTVQAIEARGLTVLGLVLNDMEGGLKGGPAGLGGWNLADLRAELACPVVPMPRIQVPAGLASAGQALWSALKG
jgi:dethiobiotin synthase